MINSSLPEDTQNVEYCGCAINVLLCFVVVIVAIYKTLHRVVGDANVTIIPP